MIFPVLTQYRDYLWKQNNIFRITQTIHVLEYLNLYILFSNIFGNIIQFGLKITRLLYIAPDIIRHEQAGMVCSIEKNKGGVSKTVLII